MDRYNINAQNSSKNNQPQSYYAPQPGYNQVQSGISNYQQNQAQLRTPGYNNDVNSYRTPGNSKLGSNTQPFKQDQDYYNTNMSYQQNMQKQIQNNQMNTNYQQQYQQSFQQNGIKNNSQQNSPFHRGQSNQSNQRQENSFRENGQRGQQGISNNFHNIHNDNYSNQNQQQTFSSSYQYPNQKIQQQNNSQYRETPNPNPKESTNNGQLNSARNQYDQNKNQKQYYGGENTNVTPTIGGSNVFQNRTQNQQQHQQNTSNQNQQRNLQSKEGEKYYHNNEDISGSQQPESLILNSQISDNLTLESSRLNSTQLTNQKSAQQMQQINNSDNKQNQEILKQENTPSNVIHNEYEKQDNQNDQQGYLYQSQNFSKFYQDNNPERYTEQSSKMKLLNSKEDFALFELQNSTPQNKYKNMPPSANYHPGKVKQFDAQNQFDRNKQKKEYQPVEQEENKRFSLEYSQSGDILEIDESHIDTDINAIYNTLENQGNHYNNNHLYGQYNNDYYNENEQNRNLSYQRSDAGKRESLFKFQDYDPAMFKSVGYFYASVGAQQVILPRFNKEEITQNLKNVYEGHPQKLKIFEDLVKQYLIDQEQVQIKFINRHITGLQSAENLGDYFINKYSSNQEKRVAGCSRAQVFPVYIGVRGDGNCFYRALIVSYLVHLLTKEENIEKFEQFICDIDQNKHPLIELEYQNQIRDDSEQVKIILMQQLLLLLIERKQAISKDEISLFLMKMFDSISSDHDFDYSLVSLCRSMIAYALDKYGTNPIYSEYLLQEDIQQTRFKLSTYKEDAEYHAINLSTEIFKHPIQILQLQKNKYGYFEFNENVIYSPQVNEPAEGNIYILLNDGHYDLVFDRETCLDYFPSLSLFKKHQKYRDDLEDLIQNSETKETQRQHYLNLMDEYQSFLQEQNNQVVKVRESYANMQSLFQSKIARYSLSSQSNIAQGGERNENMIKMDEKSTIQNSNENESKLFDTITSYNQSARQDKDIHLLSGDKTQNYDQTKDSYQNKEITINRKNDNPDASNQQNMMNTPSKLISPQQIDITIVDNKSQNLSNQKQSQIKSSHESSFLSPQKATNHHFQSNYYNIESNKLQKKQNFQATPMGDFDANMKKNIKQIQESKDQSIQCDHAANNSITIKYITCCKMQYEVCYPCFKTRQIIQCSVCKKEILSHQRVIQTTKNCQYYCSKCKKQPQVVVFFNKVYCQQCDLQH